MKRMLSFVLMLVGVVPVLGNLWAQQDRRSLSTGPEPRKVATASLEERIAAAKSVKVVDSVLGVALGSELDEAHAKLDSLSAPGKPPKEEGNKEETASDEEKKAAGRLAADKSTDAPITKAGRDADKDEGHKVLWQLAGTNYSAVYVTADDKERIISVTGILRPGKEIPFDQVGEIAKAPICNDRAVVWDVLRPGRPLCRVLAKGTKGQASTLTLFVAGHLSADPSQQSAEKEDGKND